VKPKPYPFQQEGIQKITKFGGRALLADQMGLGKTLQALWWMRKNVKPPVVVVCPASLKWNWEREARINVGVRALVLHGKSAYKIPQSAKLVIINFDILGAWVKELKKLKISLVIIDECQYIKSRGAKRTKAAKSLCRGVKNVIGLSGTPLTNRPVELFPILSILYPSMFKSFVAYAWQYCDPKHNGFGWNYNGASNLRELHNLLGKKCMIRRLKKDVLQDLPDKTRSVIPLEISRSEYDFAESDFINWLREESPEKVERARGAMGLVKLGYLKRLASSLKLKGSIEWIDNYLSQSDGKLVIFAIHKKTISKLREHYKGLAVVVDGSVSGERRQEAVDQFQKLKKVRIFIGNIQAAGVGITLTAADTVVFVEMGWTPGEHIQGEDRIHRIGQSKKTSCYYLVATGTIEEDLCDIIQKKQLVLESVLDGNDEIEEMDLMGLLTDSIKSRG